MAIDTNGFCASGHKDLEAQSNETFDYVIYGPGTVCSRLEYRGKKVGFTTIPIPPPSTGASLGATRRAGSANNRVHFSA